MDNDTVERLTRESAEVYYVRGALPSVESTDIAFVKARAAENPRRRCRLCLHDAPAALQHEMVIVHLRDAYVRPHRHRTRSESLIVIEGTATAFTFDDSGRVTATMQLGPPGSDARFSYFMPPKTWHSLIVTSPAFVFIEAAAGPFDPSLTSFPEWAPDGSDAAAAQAFADALETSSRPPA